MTPNPYPNPSTTYNRYGPGALPLVYDRATLEIISPCQPLKHCGKCATDKARSEFHRNAAKHDGLQTACKACRAPLLLAALVKSPWRVAMSTARSRRGDTVTTTEQMKALVSIKKCQVTGRSLRNYLTKGAGTRRNSRVILPARADANGANGGLLVVCGAEFHAKKEGLPSAALSALIAKACASIDTFNAKRSTV